MQTAGGRGLDDWAPDGGGDETPSGWKDQLGVALIAAVIAGVLAAISLAVPHHGVAAALWLPNAVVLALLLTRPVDQLVAAMGGAAVGLMFGEIAGQVPAGPATLLTGANLVEIGLAALLTRKWCGRRVDFTDPQAFFLFIGALLIASLVSALAAAGISGFAGAPMFFARHASSLVFIAPLLIVAAEGRRRSEMRQRMSPAVLAIAVIGSVAIFAQSSFPFLFMVTPLVVLAGISSGIGGTALALMLLAAVATGATALGSGPIVLTRGDPSFQFVTLQMFIASLSLVGLPLAGLIERNRIDRDALRAGRDEKRRLLDNIDEVIFCIDSRGRWQALNAAWERITGRDCAGSLGEPFDAFLPERERERVGAELVRLQMGARDVSEIALSFERPNGEMRHIEMRMRAAPDGAGQSRSVIGHILDITEKAKGRAALEASERQFATLAELAPAGLFRSDAKGRCLWVNQAWIEATGLTNGSWHGTGWADAIHPDDFDRVYYAWNEAVAAGEPFEGTWRWRRPDGSITWISSAAAPQFDGDGRLIGHIGINMDITRSREAEAKLEERDRHIKVITDNVRDALVMIGTDGRCRFASPFAGTMFRLAPEELVGRPFSRLFGAEAAQAVDRRLLPLWRGSENNCAFRFQASIPGASDDLWLEAHFSVVRREGEIDALVAAIRDVSEAKRLEDDLTNARRKAEHAAQAKAGFLANMSHEIRTPMNGVIGFTDLLLASPLCDTQRRHAQLIADSGKAMMRLLNDILDMSKIDSGKLAIAPAPVDLRAKIGTCISLLQPSASRNGIALLADVDSAVPARLVGDPLRLRQILLNLIGNAVKFTEHGEVRVIAGVERDAAGSSLLTIAVADTGIGISADRIEEIFGQFRQADGSIARRYGGTGLGLAISSQLARLMGGEIAVHSTPGVGTTFTLRIPLEVASDDAEVAHTDQAVAHSLAESVAAAPVMPQMGAEPPRVLVAEDHDINQELILAMARQAGLDPDLAGDGAEAIRMVAAAQHERRPYRLVLMDMQMPEMDGLEATRQLRERGFTAQMLPIVALTANCFADDIAACAAAGMQGHLAKPVQIDGLRETVARHIANDTGRDDSQAQPKVPLSAETDVQDDDLARRYLERKRQLLLDLAAVAEGKCEPEWDVLAMQLHKLAGTAGYFGDARLGELARLLEDGLRGVEDAEARRALVCAEWDAVRSAA